MPEPEDDFGFEEDPQDDFGFMAESAPAVPVSDEAVADVPEPSPAPSPAPQVSMLPGWRLPAQGITLGWGDELVAAAKSAVGDRTYTEELARERARLAAERAQHPTPGLAEFSGALPLAAVPGVGGGSLAGMAGTGAAMGAVGAAGASDAPELQSRLRAAAPGALVGAGTGVLGHSLGRGLQAIGRGLMAKGASKTAESIGATPPQMRSMQRIHGTPEEIGERMRATGMTGSAKRIAERAEGIIDRTGEEIGDIYRQAHEAVEGQPVVNVERIRQNLMKRAAETTGMPEADTRNRVFSSWLKKLEGADSETIERMHKRLVALQQKAEGFKRGSPRSRAMRDVVDAYRSELQDAVGSVDPSLRSQLVEANKKFSLAKSVKPAAEGQASRQEADNAFGVRNMLAGGLGAVAYGGVEGAALGAIRPFAARYSKPITAAMLRGAGRTSGAVGRGLERAGPALSKPAATRAGAATAGEPAAGRNTTDVARSLVTSPSRDLLSLGTAGFKLQQAAAKGDQEFNAEHWRLLVGDPEYRQKIEEISKRNLEKQDAR